MDKLGDEPETAGEAISADVAAMSASALDAALVGLFAGLIRDGDIARFPEVAAALEAEVDRQVALRAPKVDRQVALHTAKVHVPEPKPAPKPAPVTVPAEEPTPTMETTYSKGYYEALGIPVAAELYH